jgi:hypothetical protein
LLLENEQTYFILEKLTLFFKKITGLGGFEGHIWTLDLQGYVIKLLNGMNFHFVSI